MSTAFYTDGEYLMTQNVDISHTLTNEKSCDLGVVYEIPRCTKWIQDNNFKRVALQFPDELLVDSPAVLTTIESTCEVKVFILGDTSYGSCCVDEVAAQHYEADCIIHFGHSCLSPTSHLPVLFVFGHQPIDGTQCCQGFYELFPNKDKKVVVLFDVVYTHMIDHISEELSKLYHNICIAELSCLGKTDELKKDNSNNTVVEHSGRRFIITGAIEDYCMFYIGEESLTLTNFMMTFNKCAFYTFNPVTKTSRRETKSVNKMLMKRFYMIERAKDAQIVGIVAGTLGVSDYLSEINRLKDITKKAGKKTYTFVMGKLNVAKMANFMEVDVYVLVACPENSLIDSTEFYKPIVTPYEMELACNRHRDWTGEYVTDYRELLPGGCRFEEVDDDHGDDDGADVSLITGKIRTMTHHYDDQNQRTTSLVKRDDLMTVANMQTHSAGEFLRNRSWQGLEQKLGETPVTKAVEGTIGIAAGYHHEPDT